MLVQARVQFKRPKTLELKQQGFSLVDMHIHSNYSDGINRVSSIVKKAQKKGFGIAMTDHNEIRGCLEALQHKDCYIIPGIETNSDEGIHTLFYFYSPRDLEEFYNSAVHNYKRKNPNTFLKTNLAELLEKARNYSCVISAAHPFSVAWTGMFKSAHKNYVTEETIQHIDALEVITGSNLHRANKKAIEFADKIKKGITGGSDGHTLNEMGRVVTYTFDNLEPNEFLDAITDNSTYVMGKETQIFHRAATHSVKINAPMKDPMTSLTKGIDYMKKRDYKLKHIIEPIVQEISAELNHRKEQIKKFFMKRKPGQ